MDWLGMYGIRRTHIIAAIDAFRQGETVEPKNFSSTTYIVDPEYTSLWDLKPVVVRASVISRLNDLSLPELLPEDFITHKPILAILALGFQVVVFNTRNSARRLGLRGYNPTALEEAHVVKFPDGTEIANYFDATGSIAGNISGPAKFTTTSSRFVRNSDLVRLVLKMANGSCTCCGGKSFQTPADDWYLEVHHKNWLSEGGPDVIDNMIALCPNCHANEHHGKNRKYY